MRARAGHTMQRGGDNSWLDGGALLRLAGLKSLFVDEKYPQKSIELSGPFI